MSFANATTPVSKPAPPVKAAKERVAAISREDFLKNAEPIEVRICGYPVMLDPRVFSSGSYGFGPAGAPPKIDIKFGEGKDAVVVSLCLSMSLVVANSKPKG